MADELISPNDTRATATLCAEALRPYQDRDWSVPAGTLEWSCRRTLFHMNGALFSYMTHLAGRWQEPTTFRLGALLNRSDGSDASPETLLDALPTMAALLATVAESTPPTTRAYHMAGMADPSGFLAMGCDELLIHTGDILSAFDTSFRPPADLATRVLRRLFPWAPPDVDPWQALLWANGRTDLPDRPNPGPDWIWHCAPLEEWGGTIPQM
jgi:hypothetical protein